jgi:hypothetical protein
MRKAVKIAIWISLAAIVVFFVMPNFKHVAVPNGGEAHACGAPLWRAVFREAKASFDYTTKKGDRGSFAFWEDIADGPIMLMQGKDTNILYCLYDFDVELILVRIDTSKPNNLSPLPDRLNRITFDSTWSLTEADFSEWQYVISELQHMSSRDYRRQLLPSSFRFRRTVDPNSIIQTLSYQGIRPEH